MYEWGDTLTLKIWYDLVKSKALNVFYYAPLAASARLLTETELARFGVGVINVLATAIKAIQHTNVLWDRWELLTNYASGMFTGGEATTQGTASGEALPDFVAWGFRSARPNLNCRAATRRIGGVSESDTTGGNITGTATARLGAVASTLGAAITFLADDGVTTLEYHPVLLVRTVAGTELATPEVYRAQGWSVQGITSQNSRKD